MKLDIEPERLGPLCICAVRYCQGRQTYMPDLIRSIVRPMLPKLSTEDIRVMLEDCAYQARFSLYGDDRIDKPGWLKWEQDLREELERRTT